MRYGLQYSIFANPNIGKINDLFRYRKKFRKGLYIKQVYSRYAYNAFRENLHISMEAQLILNKLYKTLCIQVKVIKKKKKKETNAQKRKRNVYFLMHICTHDVISDIPAVFGI